MNTKYCSKNQSIIIKRRRSTRRNRRVVFILSLLIMVSFISLFCSKSNASDNDTHEYYKYYKSIQVDSEDSIYELASMYAIDEMTTIDKYVAEVMFMNNMESPEFPVSGCCIIIPYYDTIHQ